MEQADKIKEFLSEHEYCVSVQNIKSGCEVNIPARLVLPCNGKALKIVYRVGKTSVRQQGWYLDSGQKVKDVVKLLDKNGKEITTESFVDNMDIPVPEERKNEFSEKSQQLGHLFMESYKENFQTEAYENLSVAMGVSDGFYMLKGIFWEVLGQ